MPHGWLCLQNASRIEFGGSGAHLGCSGPSHLPNSWLEPLPYILHVYRWEPSAMLHSAVPSRLIMTFAVLHVTVYATFLQLSDAMMPKMPI